NYLGNCYLEKNDFDRAFEWLERSLQIRLKNTDADPGAVADSRNDLGLFYEKMGNYQEALRQYEAALKINEKKKNGKDPDVANSYDRIGDVFLAEKKHTAASTYFYKALNIRLKLYGNRHPDVADLYRKLALTCPKDTVCAFEHLDSAFAAVGFEQAISPLSTSHSLTLSPSDFGKAISPLVLLEIFQTKGVLLHQFFDANGKIEHLKAADQTYRLGMELIDFIKITFEEAGSRRALLDRFFQLYEDAIAVKCRLKKATGQASFWREAFEISERSNATLLLEAMQTVEAERFANIPDSLLQAERRLKIDLAFLEKLRYEEEWKGDSADLRKLNELQGRIFKLKTAQSKLMDKFRERFPDYFEKKYAPGIVQVGDIQRNLLKEGQTMLAYFVGENTVFAFVISKEAFEVVEISKDFPLEAWVEEFRNSIYRFNPARKDIEFLSQKFANIGHELWQLIFEPVQQFLKTDKLVIVPGGVLGYLPFEALLAKQPAHYAEFDSHPYLILNYQISYTYSATLLQEMQEQEKRTGSGGFLAFAPSYSGDTLDLRSDPWRAVLGRLQYNEWEAQTIGKIMQG
ncbi:MAG: tetratricopeptide repeat protein, partial [Bacteroidota bacterium]